MLEAAVAKERHPAVFILHVIQEIKPGRFHYNAHSLCIGVNVVEVSEATVTSAGRSTTEN